MEEKDDDRKILTEEEVETLEESGLSTELGTPITLFQGDVLQQVLWPTSPNDLPDEMYDHEVLEIQPPPTSGWVSAAEYDWISDQKKFVRRKESTDGDS